MTGYEVKKEFEGYNVVYDGWLTVCGFTSKKKAQQFVRKLENEDFYNVR